MTTRRLALIAATLLAVSACAQPPLPAPPTVHPLQQQLDTAVREGIPGVQVVITDLDRSPRVLRAGTGDPAFGEPVPDNARVPIGGSSETFTATVVMQLVHEGRVRLDQRVENGATVRELLQRPGGSAELGKLVERVTDRSMGTEIANRIGYRLGLSGTDFPVTTAVDLNKFWTALLHGNLLPPQRLAEMKRDGLGLRRPPNTCGREVWGHRGTAPDFTAGGVTAGGRAVTITFHHLGDRAETATARIVDAAWCAN
ncbi:serine hydrolase [Crossiella sp. CA-258035]|uniref:serine hydrolase domain-containing protein n=1 Tax=Crossiella sp. CA-258035 TaxID=2981138 RepID=UPI0024BCCD93|nr:serine hydrolase domain-containing protein [Crossiella sp. CA-258035]WHT22476.1 serine hydrolase [Crossiella sp. CA-258035]